MKRFVLLSLPASALLVHGANLIQNSSFEAPALIGDSALSSVQFFNGGSNIGGAWTVNGPADRNVLTVHQNFENFEDALVRGFSPAQSGVQYLDLSGAYFTGTAPSVTQDFATIPGAQYELSFYLGASDGFNATPLSEHPPLNTVNVRIDDVFGPNILDELLTAPAPAGGQIQWGQHSFVFTAGSSSTRLSFQDLSGFDDNTSFVDAVSVQAVPDSLHRRWALGAVVATMFAGVRVRSRR